MLEYLVLKKALKNTLEKAVLVPDHPLVASVCENIAELYEQIEKEEEAERLKELQEKSVQNREGNTPAGVLRILSHQRLKSIDSRWVIAEGGEPKLSICERNLAFMGVSGNSRIQLDPM